MKKSTDWSVFVELVIAAGCVAYLAYWNHKRASQRKYEEKLDSSLAETFPASDPVSY